MALLNALSLKSFLLIEAGLTQSLEGCQTRGGISRSLQNNQGNEQRKLISPVVNLFIPWKGVDWEKAQANVRTLVGGSIEPSNRIRRQ